MAPSHANSLQERLEYLRDSYGIVPFSVLAARMVAIASISGALYLQAPAFVLNVQVWLAAPAPAKPWELLFTPLFNLVLIVLVAQLITALAQTRFLIQWSPSKPLNNHRLPSASTWCISLLVGSALSWRSLPFGIRLFSSSKRDALILLHQGLVVVPILSGIAVLGALGVWFVARWWLAFVRIEHLTSAKDE